MRISLLILSLSFIFNNATCQSYVTFEEDFDDNKNEWSESDVDKRYSEVKNGKFIIEQKESGSSGFWKEVTTNPHYNYSIEADFKQVSGVDNNGYGLLWGRYDWDDYYAFVVSSNGFAKIYGKVDAEKVSIKDWTEFSAVKPMGETNNLKIVQKDKQVKFYVNGELFHTNEYIATVGELTGFKLDNNMRVEVDYIDITHYKQPINLISDPENGYELENLGHNVNTAIEEKSPFITADGKTLYFNRKDDPQNYAPSYTDIWFSKLDTNTNEWGPAKHMGKPLNNTGHNFIISVTPDNNKALLGNTYKSDGSKGSAGVSLSYKKNGNWGVPQTQIVHDFKNNDKYVNYFLTSDGTKLLMSIDDGETHGNKDLFVSFLQGDSTWTKPLNMGNVLNSFMTDFSPFLASDNKTLFFSSYGHPGYGSSDIFMSTRKDDTWTNWTTPQNLGPEINTDDWDAYFALPAKGDYAYLVSQKNSLGDGDIFRIKVPESIKPEPVLIVKGMVVDKKTHQPIDGYVEYENLSTGVREGIAHSNEWDGYSIVLPAGSNYGFRAEAKGYIPVSENIDLSNLTAFSDTVINLFVVPVEKGQKIALNNIFFDVGKSTLRDESELELRRMIDILMTHNEYKFEIGGHTDNSGEDKDNKNLSIYRAQTVYKFLIKHGIPESRLSYKGYGSKYPIDSNDSEIGRQNNRRVEITIL